MKKRCLMTIMVASAFVLSSSEETRAETLLGKNYVGGSYQVVQFGDDIMDDIFGNGYGVTAFWNINLFTNVDLGLGGGYSWADGRGIYLRDDGSKIPTDIDSTGMLASVDVIYSFRPEKRVNPFLDVGIGVLKSETDYSGDDSPQDEDETEIAYAAAAGIEYEATEKVLLSAQLDFFYIDSEDSVDVSWDAGYWFTERIIGMIGASYNFDSENTVGFFQLISKL